MIPILYKANEKDFEHNGIGPLVEVAANAVVAAQRVINKAPERVFREIGRIWFL